MTHQKMTSMSCKEPVSGASFAVSRWVPKVSTPSRGIPLGTERCHVPKGTEPSDHNLRREEVGPAFKPHVTKYLPIGFQYEIVLEGEIIDGVFVLEKLGLQPVKERTTWQWARPCHREDASKDPTISPESRYSGLQRLRNVLMGTRQCFLPQCHLCPVRVSLSSLPQAPEFQKPQFRWSWLEVFSG